MSDREERYTEALETLAEEALSAGSPRVSYIPRGARNTFRYPGGSRADKLVVEVPEVMIEGMPYESLALYLCVHDSAFGGRYPNPISSVIGIGVSNIAPIFLDEDDWWVSGWFHPHIMGSGGMCASPTTSIGSALRSGGIGTAVLYTLSTLNMYKESYFHREDWHPMYWTKIEEERANGETPDAHNVLWTFARALNYECQGSLVFGDAALSRAREAMEEVDYGQDDIPFIGERCYYERVVRYINDSLSEVKSGVREKTFNTILERSTIWT